jgi:hypothetical protein
MWGKRNLHKLLVGMQASATTPEKKKVWRLLKNLNIDLPFASAIPLPGIYQKECDSRFSRGNSTPMFTAALFPIAKL